jgi:multidrug efflux pump
VAVVFTPLIGVTLLPATMHRQDAKPGRFARLFHRILILSPCGKYWVIAGTILLAALEARILAEPEWRSPPSPAP